MSETLHSGLCGDDVDCNLLIVLLVRVPALSFLSPLTFADLAATT